MCRSKKTSKLRVTGLCAMNSQVTGEFPAQIASNAENVSIWWRHHAQNITHVYVLQLQVSQTRRMWHNVCTYMRSTLWLNDLALGDFPCNCWSLQGSMCYHLNIMVTNKESNAIMTSSNGNIFRVTGLLCGEFIGHRWIPRTKASDAELWCSIWFALE